MPAMTPTEFNAFCVQVLRLTGLPVARYHMLGWKAMFESLKRFPGQTPLARSSDLRVCEQCPSETAPKVRLAPRGGVGAASDDVLAAATAETAVAELASTGTVALGAASDAREDAVSGALSVLFGVGSSSDMLAGVRPSEPIVRATRVFDVPMGAGRTVAMHKHFNDLVGEYLSQEANGQLAVDNIANSDVFGRSTTFNDGSTAEETAKLSSFRRRSSVLAFAVTHYEQPEGMPVREPNESSLMGDGDISKWDKSSVLPSVSERDEHDGSASEVHFRRQAASAAVSPAISPA